jgi:pimeloyl-ACP methyl ester carboxylesterase
LLLVSGGFGIGFFFPIQLAEWCSRFELWRQGVTTLEANGLHGYLRDTCEAPSTPRDCTCVALIHGLADNALTWEKTLLAPANALPERLKIYAFDLPGTGQSTAPAQLSDYRVRRQAERLKQSLAPLCSHWVIVGNSLGGWIAAWLALDWSEGVSKVVLADSAGLKDELSESDVRSFFINPSVPSLKEFQARAFFQGKPLPDFIWRAAVSRMKASNTRQVLEAQTPEDYLDERLSALKRPTMVLWGEADRITPVSFGQKMRALIPGAVWREAPRCGHLPQKECPLEVTRAIGDLVRAGGI